MESANVSLFIEWGSEFDPQCDEHVRHVCTQHRFFFLYHHYVGIFPRCLPLEWDSVQVSTTILAHPTQSVAEEVVQQRSEDGLSPSQPLSPPSPLSTPLYWDVAKPSCAFLRAGWGGPGCARPLGVPPS